MHGLSRCGWRWSPGVPAPRIESGFMHGCDMMTAKTLTEVHMARRAAIMGIVGFIAPFILAAIPVGPVLGVEGATQIPDMAGSWSRLTFGFEQPASGPGPIGR